MDGIRVLLTNNTLATRCGSELYVRDLACGLLARGHRPVAYSPLLGDVAADLRAATVPVIDDLRNLSEPPDLIHGQHHVEAMTALLHFPRTPAIYVCHGWLPWEEHPPLSPRIRRYVAVDHTCRDRLVCENGIPPEQVRVELNFVDLDRFRSRGPLPPKPKRALVLNNHVHDRNILVTIREACTRHGIELDVAGIASGNSLPRPEAVVGNYDLVFATGRSALESLAVGCAVILCHIVGSGPLVTTAEFDRLRALNFGVRTLRKPVTADILAEEIGHYDANDATEVSRRLRAEVGLNHTLDRYEALYREVLSEDTAPNCDTSQSDAAYLRWMGIGWKKRQDAVAERDWVRSELEHNIRELGKARADGGILQDELSRLRAAVDSLRAESRRLRTVANDLQTDLNTVHATFAMRLRRTMRHLPIAGSLLRGLRRVG